MGGTVMDDRLFSLFTDAVAYGNEETEVCSLI